MIQTVEAVVDAAGQVRLLGDIHVAGPCPADKRSQIFAPFEQADNSPTLNFGSTGLGLSIALLDSQSFDLVLMGVQMPEKDGLETTRLIRTRESQTGRPRRSSR